MWPSCFDRRTGKSVNAALFKLFGNHRYRTGLQQKSRSKKRNADHFFFIYFSMRYRFLVEKREKKKKMMEIPLSRSPMLRQRGKAAADELPPITQISDFLLQLRTCTCQVQVQRCGVRRRDVGLFPPWSQSLLGCAKGKKEERYALAFPISDDTSARNGVICSSGTKAPQANA